MTRPRDPRPRSAPRQGTPAKGSSATLGEARAAKMRLNTWLAERAAVGVQVGIGRADSGGYGLVLRLEAPLSLSDPLPDDLGVPIVDVQFVGRGRVLE